jgi:hypothetical protein
MMMMMMMVVVVMMMMVMMSTTLHARLLEGPLPTLRGADHRCIICAHPLIICPVI